jgi:hypothetical protein
MVYRSLSILWLTVLVGCIGGGIANASPLIGDESEVSQSQNQTTGDLCETDSQEKSPLLLAQKNSCSKNAQSDLDLCLRMCPGVTLDNMVRPSERAAFDRCDANCRRVFVKASQSCKQNP